MENIDMLIEINLDLIKTAPNIGVRRLELINLELKTLPNNESISLYKILSEENLVFENENKDLYLTGKAEKIMSEGGWLKHLNAEKIKANSIIEKEKLDFEKSKIDLVLAKKMLKEYPYTKWLARVGALIGIVLGLKELGILIKKWLLL